MSYCTYCKALHAHGKHTRALHAGHPDYKEDVPAPKVTTLRCGKCDESYDVLEGHVCPGMTEVAPVSPVKVSEVPETLGYLVRDGSGPARYHEHRESEPETCVTRCTVELDAVPTLSTEGPYVTGQHRCAEADRWAARVKELEERNERAAKILRGEE